MYKIKLLALILVILAVTLTTQRIDAARNDGTSLKMDCKKPFDKELAARAGIQQ